MNSHFLSCFAYHVMLLLLKKNRYRFSFVNKKIGTNRTIKVDINGKGEFKTVQAAIDSVPEGNSNWVIIHIRKGVYREKVHIPKIKHYIFLRGNGRGKTAIGVKVQMTMLSLPPSKLKLLISLHLELASKNEAPTGVAYTSQNQSVAAFVAADKTTFYHCAFYSTHNTLFDYIGRHYYESCYIQGSIDFILGRGRTIFQSCEIFVVDNKRITIRGSITAAAPPRTYNQTGNLSSFSNPRSHDFSHTNYILVYQAVLQLGLFTKNHRSKMERYSS